MEPQLNNRYLQKYAINGKSIHVCTHTSARTHTRKHTVLRLINRRPCQQNLLNIFVYMPIKSQKLWLAGRKLLYVVLHKVIRTTERFRGLTIDTVTSPLK
jgi:hypothetical protein